MTILRVYTTYLFVGSREGCRDKLLILLLFIILLLLPTMGYKSNISS